MKENNILVIQLRQLGDILLTTPVLREIKKENPECHLSFLSHPMGRKIITGSPYVDEHILYDEKEGFLKQVSFLRGLKNYNFDMVLDFMTNPRSALQTMATSAEKRISFSSSRNFAYTDIVDRGNDSHYIVNEKFQLLTSAGYSPSSIKLDLPWQETDLAPLYIALQEFSEFEAAPIRIVMSPTHRRVRRQWSLDKYAALADRLVERWHASITWIWGPGEEDVIDEVISKCKELTFKAPATNFHEAAAYIANHDLFIGNSNGPSHVAVAADICSYQLHGHTNLTSWCPMTEKHRGIQSREYGKENATLDSILVENVWADLQNMKPILLEQSSKRKSLGVIKDWRL